jgi:hypothetical protein
MKVKGRLMAFNALSLLEKTWDQRGSRITYARIQTLWPETSLSVIHRAVGVLRQSGAYRTRRVKLPGRKPFTYFYVTPIGRRMLREMLPFWQIWGKVQPREVLMFGIREKTYLKIAASYKSLFGKEAPNPGDTGYWGRRGPRDTAFI